MTSRLWQSAIDRAGVLASPLALAELPDAELLQRFLADRDEHCFAALVRRHGPLVWSVCRSLLSTEADAEDAFQATFLVLVRSARRVSKPNALGAWLHTVAGRVCRNSLRSLARRKKHERNAAHEDVEQPVAAAAWERWQTIAHEEIGRLPESLRVPFVLCVLQGVRQPDAARQLGWKLGTVSGRVCKAKQSLTEALARRGIAAGILAGLGAASPLEASLNDKGNSVIRTGVGPDGGCSTIVHELAKGAMGGLMTKTKLLATAIVVGTLAVGVGSQILSRADAQFPGGGGGRPPGLPGGPGGAGGPGPGGLPPGAPSTGPGSLGSPFGGAGGFSMRPHPKVEYTFLPKIASADDFKKTLAKRGEDGWEFAGLVPGSDEIILKRTALAAMAGGGMGGGPMGPPSGMPGGGGGVGRFNPGVGPASGGSGGPGAPGPMGPGAGSSSTGGEGPSEGGMPPPPGGAGGLPPMKPVTSYDLRVGETIRHRISARQSIDRILNQSTQVLEVNPDPTDSTKVLIKGLSAGTAKVELTDAVGTKVTLTIRVGK